MNLTRYADRLGVSDDTATVIHQLTEDDCFSLYEVGLVALAFVRWANDNEALGRMLREAARFGGNDNQEAA